MKKAIYMFCALAVCLLSACGKGDSAGLTAEEADSQENEAAAGTDAAEADSGTEEKTVVYSTLADLTHDNAAWTVQVEIEGAKYSGAYYVRAYDEENELVWEDRMADTHAESAIYFLIHGKDGDYILWYLPDYATGTCVYEFTLFHFDEAGQMVLDDEDKVEFTAEPSTLWNEETMYPEDRMEAFADHLNGYLENGYLLIDTYYHTLQYSTADELITFEENYGYLLKTAGIAESDGAAENIAAYKEYLLEETHKLAEQEE